MGQHPCSAGHPGPSVSLALLPQTFIDMEGSGFGGDLETVRVSVGPLLRAGSKGRLWPSSPSSLTGPARATRSSGAPWRARLARGAGTVWDEQHRPARTTGAARQRWGPRVPGAGGRSGVAKGEPSQGHPAVAIAPCLPAPQRSPVLKPPPGHLAGSSRSSWKRRDAWATRAQRRAGECPPSCAPRMSLLPPGAASTLGTCSSCCSVPWCISGGPGSLQTQQAPGWGSPTCSPSHPLLLPRVTWVTSASPEHQDPRYHAQGWLLSGGGVPLQGCCAGGSPCTDVGATGTCALLRAEQCRGLGAQGAAAHVVPWARGMPASLAHGDRQSAHTGSMQQGCFSAFKHEGGPERSQWVPAPCSETPRLLHISLLSVPTPLLTSNQSKPPPLPSCLLQLLAFHSTSPPLGEARVEVAAGRWHSGDTHACHPLPAGPGCPLSTTALQPNC